MIMCSRAHSRPPDEKVICLLRQSIALAAIAVQDCAITAHIEDIPLGNGRFCVFHVRVEVICVLEVVKVIFAAEFASCAGGDRERERNEE